MTPDEAALQSQDLTNHLGYVYQLKFPNGKLYIGQTTRLWKYRLNQHCCHTSTCKALHAAIMKYSAATISFSILQYCDTREELNNIEEKYIQELNTTAPNGYNIMSSVGKINFSTNPKLDKRKLGAYYTKEQKVDIAQYNASEEDRLNAFMYLSGVDSYIKFMFNALGLDDICKAKWRNPETKQQFREKYLNKLRDKYGKRVLFVEKNKIFKCAEELADFYPEEHFRPSRISAYCLGKAGCYKGYHFEYVDITDDERAEIEARRSKLKPSNRSERYPKHTKIPIQMDMSGNIIFEYKSMRDTKKYGFDVRGVSRCCNGHTQSYRGYLWKYK